MSSPANSQPEAEDVDQSVPTPPDENENDPSGEKGEGTMNENTQGYDFEVKEQDRWLPIANGKLHRLLASPHSLFHWLDYPHLAAVEP